MANPTMPNFNTLYLYVIAGFAIIVLLMGVYILSKRRRPPVVPPAEPEPEKVRPDLKLVPGEPEALPAVEKPKALKEGLAKTRGGFIARMAGLLGKKQIDAGLIDQLEEILFTADIGAKTSAKLFEAVKSSLSRAELADADAVWRVIRKESEAILRQAGTAGPIDTTRAKPFVLLTIGVNGVGKTTTIGKLAAKWSGEGKRVILAAGDTFRAAATEQLEIWGQRANAPVVKGKEGGDPSSVIFDGVRRGEAEGYDIVIADTAGRLHTKTNLMEELQKVRRVLQKAMPTAPHETLLVLDATNGQNAIAQATLFKQAMDITGIVLTKLDGTAKGGVILGICDELKVPVRYVGIGEKVDDLRVFDPAEFVAALYDQTDMQTDAGV
ncbi:MAG TPA: signal recognition particle-docking protein FtsY [Kofleriaceae bacterium]|nr:signal recognition particle-docking protein FtsY [Kofleriaceae bacterium]